MSDKKKKVPKWVISVIIPLAIALILCAAVLITNIFIPIKYFTAYMVSAKKRAEGELRVTYIDVGFGDSALAEFPDGKVLLIDGGDGSYNNELALLKFLNSRGVEDIDFLICTSVKDEHCGGLKEILKYKNVKKAFVPFCKNPRITDEYNEFYTELLSSGAEYEYSSVGKGYADEQNELFFTFLSPTSEDSPLSEYAAMNSDPTADNIENASAIVWLQYKGNAFVFSSDAGAQALSSVCIKYDLSRLVGDKFCKIGNFDVKLGDCDVVTVPAHGAERTAESEWYRALDPSYAVLSVGENFSLLPSDKALADVCAYVSPLYTSENGNISFRATEDGIVAA